MNTTLVNQAAALSAKLRKITGRCGENHSADYLNRAERAYSRAYDRAMRRAMAAMPSAVPGVIPVEAIKLMSAATYSVPVESVKILKIEQIAADHPDRVIDRAWSVRLLGERTVRARELDGEDYSHVITHTHLVETRYGHGVPESGNGAWGSLFGITDKGEYRLWCD